MNIDHRNQAKKFFADLDIATKNVGDWLFVSREGIAEETGNYLEDEYEEMLNLLNETVPLKFGNRFIWSGQNDNDLCLDTVK